MNTESQDIIKKQGRPKNTAFPKFVTCKVTGKQYKINVTQLSKQLERWGKTIEEYVENYVSREGKAILEEQNDTTVEAPIINENIRKGVLLEMDGLIDDKCYSARKIVIKALWDKIAQQPPEYYQEKFKLKARQNG